MSDDNSKRTNRKLQVIDLTDQTFEFEASGFTIAGFLAVDNKQWFSAEIVCDNLGIKNISDAVSRLPHDDKAIIVLSDNGTPVRQLIVSRSGIFRLIFRSRKAEAQRYQDWVFDEVLPAIHEYGGYISPVVTQQQIADLQQELKHKAMQIEARDRVIEAKNRTIKTKDEKLNDANQVNYWLAADQRAGYFIEHSLPDNDDYDVTDAYETEDGDE